MSGSGHSEGGSNLLSSVVAIVAFIVLIVIVLWGLLHLTSFSRTWLGSLLTRTPAGISITAPKVATSSEPFTISWKYNTSNKGTYAFLYQCKAGLQVKASGPNNTLNTIPCGAAYTVPNTTSNSISVTPVLAGTSSVSVPLSIIFMPAATSTPGAQGSTAVTVRVPSAPTLASPVVTTSIDEPEVREPVQPTATSPQPKTTTSKPRSTGPADLTVRIVAVGVIDPATNTFVNRPPMYDGDVAAVQFDIGNIGGSPSGTYYFEALLPTVSGYTYVSPPQKSLGVGDHVLNTLRFTQLNPSGGNVSVTITTSDANQYNNFVSQWVNGYSYQQVNQYQPGYQQIYQYNPQQYQYVPEQTYSYPQYYVDYSTYPQSVF